MLVVTQRASRKGVGGEALCSRICHLTHQGPAQPGNFQRGLGNEGHVQTRPPGDGDKGSLGSSCTEAGVARAVGKHDVLSDPGCVDSVLVDQGLCAQGHGKRQVGADTTPAAEAGRTAPGRLLRPRPSLLP